MIRRKLEPLKRRGGERGRAKLAGKTVRIWSDQWRKYWRPDGAGYTTDPESAGLYPFADAWARTRHCGPEKRIVFEVVA